MRGPKEFGIVLEQSKKEIIWIGFARDLLHCHIDTVGAHLRWLSILSKCSEEDSKQKYIKAIVEVKRPWPQRGLGCSQRR